MINYLYIFIIGWLIFLTFLLFKLRSHYFNLIYKTKKDRLDEILDKLLEKDDQLFKELNLVKEELKKQKELSKFYFQKLGLIRFNPFDRGVEQSFLIALLNDQNSGFILNFIQTKDGLRVYTKTINKGKSEEYQLTDEEKKAIEKAEKI